jgi:polyphosphate kinase 2 (PPK2 family)
MVVLDGREAAGRGGSIRAITERVSPRVFRLVALPAHPIEDSVSLEGRRFVPQKY